VLKDRCVRAPFIEVVKYPHEHSIVMEKKGSDENKAGGEGDQRDAVSLQPRSHIHHPSTKG
jgi:hypothetical protein